MPLSLCCFTYATLFTLLYALCHYAPCLRRAMLRRATLLLLLRCRASATFTRLLMRRATLMLINHTGEQNEGHTSTREGTGGALLLACLIAEQRSTWHTHTQRVIDHKATIRAYTLNGHYHCQLPNLPVTYYMAHRPLSVWRHSIAVWLLRQRQLPALIRC